MAHLLLLNGPNLNLLGQREPHTYGTATLEQLVARAAAAARAAGHDLVAFQSNAEHELVERVHAARNDGTAFLIVNPGAFTHTSIALRDALAAEDRQRAAEESIDCDPAVRAMREVFGATVRPGSVKPLG